MSLNNSTSKGVLSLNVMKFTMFNKETNRKDAGIYNAQDRAMSLRTQVEVELRGVMMELHSLEGQNQEIYLNVKKVENAYASIAW